jgi:hypothetical protein
MQRQGDVIVFTLAMPSQLCILREFAGFILGAYAKTSICGPIFCPRGSINGCRAIPKRELLKLTGDDPIVERNGNLLYPQSASRYTGWGKPQHPTVVDLYHLSGDEADDFEWALSNNAMPGSGTGFVMETVGGEVVEKAASEALTRAAGGTVAKEVPGIGAIYGAVDLGGKLNFEAMAGMMHDFNAAHRVDGQIQPVDVIAIGNALHVSPGSIVEEQPGQGHENLIFAVSPDGDISRVVILQDPYYNKVNEVLQRLVWE